MSPFKEITLKAVRAAGGPSKVAKAIRAGGKPCTPQAVSQWAQVPDVHVRLIEAMGGAQVTRYQMRPDIFGSAPEAEKEAA